jgi:hypothetical protein
LIERPAFGVLTQRAGADEQSDLHAETRALSDLADRRDIGLERAGCAADRHVEALARHFLGQAQSVVELPLSRSREAEREALDSKRSGALQQIELLTDRRILG